jgi:carbamate kinase
MENGTIVVCGGGGGVPVQYDANGDLNGVEAVVNKSHTATLLANELEVETVIFLSEWEKIQQAFPHALRNDFIQFSLTQLRELIAERKDELTDSMYLKLIASSKFLETGGRSIWVIPPEHIEAIFNRDCGILLTPDPT